MVSAIYVWLETELTEINMWVSQIYVTRPQTSTLLLVERKFHKGNVSLGPKSVYLHGITDSDYQEPQPTDNSKHGRRRI